MNMVHAEKIRPLFRCFVVSPPVRCAVFFDLFELLAAQRTNPLATLPRLPQGRHAYPLLLRTRHPFHEQGEPTHSAYLRLLAAKV